MGGSSNTIRLIPNEQRGITGFQLWGKIWQAQLLQPAQLTTAHLIFVPPPPSPTPPHPPPLPPLPLSFRSVSRVRFRCVEGFVPGARGDSQYRGPQQLTARITRHTRHSPQGSVLSLSLSPSMPGLAFRHPSRHS